MKLIQVLLLLTWASSASAATIRVAQDGTGDFTLVQDAVESAASGDTISIGPGVYPEVRPYTFPASVEEVIAFVDVEELTIIGDGRDVVTLGPEVPTPNVEFGPYGIITTVNGNVRVSGVTIRNVSSGVGGYGDWSETSATRFVHCFYGVDGFATGFTTVSTSEFIDCDAGVVVFVARGATGGSVEDCRFRDNQNGIDLQTPNSTIQDCTFDNDILGAQVSFGGSATVENCVFNGSRNGDLAIAGGAQVHLVNSRFIGRPPVHINVNGLLTGSGNVLLGGSAWAVRVTGRSTVQFNENHILNAGDYSVVISSSATPIPPFDFTRNYWGTTDTDQIDQWILDTNDSMDPVYGIVDYLPLLGSPVRNDESSWGKLKARVGGKGGQ